MSGYWQQIFVLVGINFIAVLGVSILTGFTKLFSFGNAGFMSIGAYTSAILTTRYNVPFLLALVIGATVAGVVGYGLGSVTLGLKGDYFLITTLGFGECVRVLFEYIQPVTGGAKGISGIPHYTDAIIVGISVIVFFIFAWTLIHSKYGRNLTAIREQEVAASAVGIDTFKYKRLAFVVSAVFAGWAGGLYAHHLTYLEPKIFNLAKSSELTITTVIGGLGSLTGSLFGTCLVTLLPEVFRSLSTYRMLLYGLAVVIIITLKPSGLYGNKEISITGIIRWFKNLGKKTPAKKGA